MLIQPAKVWVLTSTDDEGQERLEGIFATAGAAQRSSRVQGLVWEVSSDGDFEATSRIPQEPLWPGEAQADYVLEFRVEHMDVEG